MTGIVAVFIIAGLDADFKSRGLKVICARGDASRGRSAGSERRIMGCVLCEHCTGECCRYIALPIDEPETRRDFEDIRWYLMHEGVTVFVEEGYWYIQIRTKCRHLQADFRCGVYETRPTICREYKAEDCDYVGGDYRYEHLFSSPEQIADFAKKHFNEQRAARRRKRASLGSGRRKSTRSRAVKAMAR